MIIYYKKVSYFLVQESKVVDDFVLGLLLARLLVGLFHLHLHTLILIVVVRSLPVRILPRLPL